MGNAPQRATRLDTGIPATVHLCSCMLAALFWSLYYFLYQTAGQTEAMSYLALAHIPFVATPYFVWAVLCDGLENCSTLRKQVWRAVGVLFTSVFFLIIVRVAVQLNRH